MSHNAEPHAPITCEYTQYCAQRNITPNTAFVDALDRNDKHAVLNACVTPLTDADLMGIAHAVSNLQSEHALRVLILEDNNFGAPGVQALMSALQSNPTHICELRLGRNRLGDAVAALIGEALIAQGLGLKVLDLCENEITAVGVEAITSAVSDKSSSVVELSFHNSKLDDAAAVHLSSALQHAAKLKHLHLGYNALGSAGVVRLARGLSLSRSLSTLDLTANAVTYDGAAALCEVLCAPDCSLQRLNLRHNTLEDGAIGLFANVLRENQSLIQLFLGFMNPRPRTVAHVLDALTYNRTLLLLDIFGWKLAPKPMGDCLTKVQDENTCVAAVITDAYHGLERRIAENNAERDGRGLHPIYVGPDDRDAYVATKSLRRYSRAQSRRNSRAPSRSNSHARAAAQATAERSGSGARARTHKQRASHLVSADDTDLAATAGAAHAHRSHTRNGAADENAAPPSSLPHSRRSKVGAHARDGDGVAGTRQTLRDTAAQSLRAPSEEQSAIRRQEGDRASLAASFRLSDVNCGEAADGVGGGGARGGGQSANSSLLSHVSVSQAYSKPRERVAMYKLDRLLQEVQGCVADTQPALSGIVGQLVAALRCAVQHSRGAMGGLEERVERLEQRRECTCALGDAASGPLRAVVEQDNSSSTNARANSINGLRVNRLIKVDGQNGSYVSSDAAINRGATARVHSGSSDSRNSINYVAGTGKNVVHNSMDDDDGALLQRGSAHEATVASVRSTSMMSSQLRDGSARVTRGGDFSCDRHPGSVLLQRSVSAISFTPDIEPSPRPDLDPPRRKSMSQYI